MIERNHLVENLKKEIKEMDILEKQLHKRISKNMEGKLHVNQKSEKNFQYYLVSDNKRIYIKKEKIKKAMEISQYEYEKKVFDVIEKRNRAAKRLLAKFEHSVEDIYNDMVEGRKRLTKPIIESDAEFIDRWYKEHPGYQNKMEMERTFFTNRNEPVRSKSEKILADLFDHHGIPYIYEPELRLKGGIVVYPDFLLLNVRLKTMYAYEHFGMMGVEEYAIHNVAKINRYQENGYLLGRNLLCSFEADNQSLDTRIIEKMLKEFLL